MALSRTWPAIRVRAHRITLAIVLGTGAALASGGAATAANNDLKLLNLCPPGSGGECSWITRNGAGLISSPTYDATGKLLPQAMWSEGPFDIPAEAQTAFRSLMSELGVAIAPRLQTPADTLGYAGFQFSAELGVTKINSSRAFWNGTEGHSSSAKDGDRADSYLTTVGGFVRKGLWLPLPAFEFGAGALNIVGSRMYVVQGYAKLALQEGFHGWWLPSFAVRGAVSQLLGTDQVDLNVYSLDFVLSKAFGLAGTSRLEPFVGGNVLFIDAQSNVIDATPTCDAYAAQVATSAKDVTGCNPGQVGGTNDTFGNFTFPQQSIITRYRGSVGFKLKLSVLFLVGEFDYTKGGSSQDGKQPATQTQAVRDQSGGQQSFSLSAGFDF